MKRIIVFTGVVLMIGSLVLAAEPSFKEFKGHGGSIMSLSFSPDDTKLASSSRDDNIHIWDLKTGQLEHKMTGHTGDVYCVAYSPDGKLFGSGSADKSVKIWDASTRQVLKTLDGHTDTVRW